MNNTAWWIIIFILILLILAAGEIYRETHTFRVRKHRHSKLCKSDFFK